MGLVVFVLLLAGCVVAYYYLTQMEKEIRAELAAGETEPDSQKEESDAVKRVQHQEPNDTLENRLLRIIRNSPDILQTNLYKEISGFDKKIIQKALLDLDRSGKISRTKSGNTYKLS